jgi:hypothetical protein
MVKLPLCFSFLEADFPIHTDDGLESQWFPSADDPAMIILQRDMNFAKQNTQGSQSKSRLTHSPSADGNSIDLQV